MDFEDTKDLLKKHDYDVRAILESLGVTDRSLFLSNAFGLFDSNNDPKDLSATKFKESFNFHLPHTFYVYHATGNNYYGLNDLFRDMSRHDIMSSPNQELVTRPLSPKPLKHLMEYYDHEKQDHNIVWALENLEPAKRITFVEEVLALAQDDEDANYLNLQYTLTHQLPHIAHMLQQEGQLYEGLGSIARAMRDHDMIYCPNKSIKYKAPAHFSYAPGMPVLEKN